MYIFYIDLRAMGRNEDFLTKIKGDEKVRLGGPTSLATKSVPPTGSLSGAFPTKGHGRPRGWKRRRRRWTPVVAEAVVAKLDDLEFSSRQMDLAVTQGLLRMPTNLQ